MGVKRSFGIGLIGLGLAAAVWAAVGSGSLTINGNTVSTDFIEKNGRTYVPLADVAKALDMKIQKSGSGYALTSSGGADQLQGQAGKVGQMMWNGFMRFEVVKVIRTDDYATQFAANPHHITPGANNDLAIVVCRIKNGMKQKATPSEIGGQNTGLTDTDGHSYALKDCDSSNNGPELIPGAAGDFALIYEIPKNEKVGDLVYQFAFFYTPDMAAQGKTLRISLADAGSDSGSGGR